MNAYNLPFPLSTYLCYVPMHMPKIPPCQNASSTASCLKPPELSNYSHYYQYHLSSHKSLITSMGENFLLVAIKPPCCKFNHIHLRNLKTQRVQLKLNPIAVYTSSTFILSKNWPKMFWLWRMNCFYGYPSLLQNKVNNIFVYILYHIQNFGCVMHPPFHASLI